ncbi:MAG: outer membrane pore protein F [Psychromonas sp.]|jgi:outer membrane pore protein F|uniref:porin n=1 Tax=Psychromonas sp. TaxID=1884585 RepID=UPI0039E6D916
MFKKTALCIALSALFVGVTTQAATIYEKDNGDNLKLYGEVGVGGHIGANTEYGEFYDNDKTYIDDSFATMGIKGRYDSVYYRLELDYERENWAYGSGDMVLSIDKMFVGYHLTDNHAVEAGLTDTAFDDYDKYGDLTFDTTVETGEAGDQANTVKYEGQISDIKLGVSYSYQSESSSGSKLGNVMNGYVGYFGDTVSAVVGLEKRNGSEGESKYGDQQLVGFGMRVNVTDALSLGINGYIEDEDIAQLSTVIVDNSMNLNDDVVVYNDYQTLRNKGALVSASYKLTPKWEVTGSYNFEEYEAWAIHNDQYGKEDYSWGNERTWATLGVNFRPSSSVIFALEGNVGEAAQDAYAYARVYF